MVGVEPLRLSLVNLKELGFTAANMFIDNHLKYYRTEKGKRVIFKLCAVRVQKYIKHSNQCTLRRCVNQLQWNPVNATTVGP